MPTFEDRSNTHPNQGMTTADMAAVARVATTRNEIIMFRDTGCWSRPYIAAGHPTKPFHVKGKSSDWGPHAGLVPYHSEFSKAFKDKDIEKGFDLNRKAIAENFARPIPLFLTMKFIREELLIDKGHPPRPPIDRMTVPRDGVLYFFCTKPNDNPTLPGKKYVLFGKEVGPGKYQIFTFPFDAAQTNERHLFLKESMGEPMLVMTVPGADLPITGDYDLFAVCPSWSGFGSMDRKMDPTLDNPPQNASFNRTKIKADNWVPGVAAVRQWEHGGPLNQWIARETMVTRVNVAQQSLDKINAAVTPEDPDRGNLTPRIAAVISNLVGAMGGRYPRVHHNAESGRPFAPDAQDGLPLTTFHPKTGIGGYGFLHATIDNVGDLRDYFSRLYHGGYFPPRNHSWGMSMLSKQSVIR